MSELGTSKTVLLAAGQADEEVVGLADDEVDVDVVDVGGVEVVAVGEV